MPDKSSEVAVKSLPLPVAEPAPLGLIGLAVAALVLGVHDLGILDAGDKSLMIPWTLCLGATAQLIAGYMDFKRNNIFGATAFTAYSLLWYAVTITLYIVTFTGADINLQHYALGLIGFLMFSLILTAATMLLNKALFGILIGIDVAIVALVLHTLVDTDAMFVGIPLLFVSALSFYTAAGGLLNTMIGKLCQQGKRAGYRVLIPDIMMGKLFDQGSCGLILSY
jgi:hypothetical protein